MAARGARSKEGFRWVFWCAVGLWGCSWMGPYYLDVLRPSTVRFHDYFEDWASARNLLEGLPIYTSHAITAPRYLGLPHDSDIERNGHPPASVLLALPLARLSFDRAMLAWNLVSLASFAASLGLVARGLGLTSRSILPALALLPLCHPLYAHLHLGQLTMVLVLLLTGTWFLDRSGRPGWAGALLGVAAAIKLFPAYMFLYFVVRRERRAIAAGAASFAAVNVLAAAVLGTTAFLDYVRVVMPFLGSFRGYAYNLSLAGFWFKLFDPSGERGRLLPLLAAPDLARIATLLSDLVVTALVVRASAGARTFRRGDAAFGLAITAMLLASPVTWDFSLPLLLLPLALIGRDAAGSLPRALALGLILVVFWLPQEMLTGLVGPTPGMATARFTLTAASIKFYALLATFALARGVCLRQGRTPCPVGPRVDVGMLESDAIRVGRPSPNLGRVAGPVVGRLRTFEGSMERPPSRRSDPDARAPG